MTKIVATNLDLLGNELQRVRLESRSTAPASPQPGQFWFDAIQGKFVFRGASATIEPTDRTSHHGAQPSSTISDLATTVKAYKLNEFARPDAAVDFNTQKITGIAAGVDPTDALAVSQLLAFGATVDSWIEDLVKAISQFTPALQVMPAAAAVATVNITLHGEAPVVDGVQTQVGQWILLTGQTDAAENGPWFLTGSTQENPEDEPTPAVWLRQRDELAPQELMTYAGAIMPVALGDVYRGTLWIHDNDTYIDSVGTLSPGGLWKLVGADRALHTGTQLASTISNLAAVVQAYRLNQFAAPNGAVSLGNQSIINLKDVDYSGGDVAAQTQAVNLRSARAIVGSSSKYKLVADVVAENFISAAMFAGTDDYYAPSGYGVTPGTVVLAVAQSNEIENGLWIVGGAGQPWTRYLTDRQTTLSPGEAVYVLGDKSVWQYVGVNNIAPADEGTAYQVWRPFLSVALGRALYKKSVSLVAVRHVDTTLQTAQTIDGTVVTAGRVLLTHQDSNYDNGLWSVSTAFVDGDPVTTWSRVDAVQSGIFEGLGAQLGETVFVLEGRHQGETWRLNSLADGEIWRNAIDEALSKRYAYGVYTSNLDLATTVAPDLVGPMVDGDLVLLTAQTNPVENGLYSVFVSGVGAWTRLPSARLGEHVYIYTNNENWQLTDANVWTRMFTNVTTEFVTNAVSASSTSDRAYVDAAVAANATADRAYAAAADAANAAADRAYADGLSTADRAYADGLSTADRAYTDTAVAGVADNSLSDFAAPSADLSIGTHKLTNVSPGTVGTDAVNLNQLNSVVAGSDSRTLDLIPAAAATVDLNGQRITNLGAPTAPSDAVNRAFVEGLANGIDWKQSVRAKSTSDVAVLAGTMTLDGVVLDPGDRVLLTNQTDPTLNGIWVVTENTSPTTPWTRAADAAQGTLSASSAVMVEEGTTFGDSQWRLLTNDDIVVGTTALNWTQIGAAVSYVNGAGLDLTGNVFSLMANVPRKFSSAVGDGAQTSFTINHNLGTRDVAISVYYDADGVEVECDVARTGINSIALGFAAPPDAASLRCVVVG